MGEGFEVWSGGIKIMAGLVYGLARSFRGMLIVKFIFEDTRAVVLQGVLL